VTQDFVKTILKIPGGSGDQTTSYLRKLGFVNADGTPSDIYKKFRNSATSGGAIATALRQGYAALYKRNEFMHALGDEDLRGLVIEETGVGDDSNVPDLIVTAIKTMKKFGKFDGSQTEEALPIPTTRDLSVRIPAEVPQEAKLGMNLSYTINLNLPATSDIAVFNAIFKSLREHLIRGSDGS